MPATFSTRSRWLWLPETSSAACAMDSSLVQSRRTIDSWGWLPCSSCSSAAPSGLLHVAMTLHQCTHLLGMSWAFPHDAACPSASPYVECDSKPSNLLSNLL